MQEVGHWTPPPHQDWGSYAGCLAAEVCVIATGHPGHSIVLVVWLLYIRCVFGFRSIL